MLVAKLPGSTYATAVTNAGPRSGQMRPGRADVTSASALRRRVGGAAYLVVWNTSVPDPHLGERTGGAATVDGARDDLRDEEEHHHRNGQHEHRERVRGRRRDRREH